MKYWLSLPIIFFGVMFFVGNSTPEVPVTVHSSSEKNQKKKRNKKHIVYRERVKAPDPFMLVIKSDHPEYHESRFDDQWQEELFYLLKHIEPDRGEMLFQAYVSEMRDHDERMKTNLRLSLNGLSNLNGESGLEPEVEEGRNPASAKDPRVLEKHHEEKLKNILGEHYELVLEQEKLFNEERLIENDI